MHSIRDREAAVVKLLAPRTHFYNLHLAPIVFALAISCVGVDASRLFAFSSMVFCVFLMWWNDQRYQGILRLLRDINSDFVNPRRTWGNYLPFVAAWLFLSLVSCGFVTKQGFQFL